MMMIISRRVDRNVTDGRNAHGRIEQTKVTERQVRSHNAVTICDGLKSGSSLVIYP